MAETTKAKAENKESKERKFSQEEVNAIVAQAIKAALELQAENIKKPEQETVKLAFYGPMSDRSVFLFGKLCKFTTLMREVNVPKEKFMTGISPTMSALLKKRKVIVKDGLTDDEREFFGVKYSDNEIINKEIYTHILDYDTKRAVEIFNKVCEEHKWAIVRMFKTALDNKDNRVNFNKIKALDNASKKFHSEGMFKPLVDALAKQMTE